MAQKAVAALAGGGIAKLIIQVVGIILVIAGLLMLPYSMATLPGAFSLGGGSIWRIDTQISEVQIYGTTIQGYPFQEQYNNPADPYNFYANIDGGLYYQGVTVMGRLPGLSVQSGLTGRWCMNEFGEMYSVGTNWNFQDPLQQSYEQNGREYFLYWYSFKIVVETVQQNAVGLAGVKISEYGAMNIDVKIQLHMSLIDPNFDTDIQGHFADTWIYDVDWTGKGQGGYILEGVQYHLEPHISLRQNIGTAIGYQNIQTTDEYAKATLVFPQQITGGAAKSDWHMLSELPAQVWITKRVMCGVMLSQPLEVGGGTDPSPFDPETGIDWLNLVFSLSLIFVGIVIVIIGTKMGGATKQNTIFNLLGLGGTLGLNLTGKKKTGTVKIDSNKKHSQNYTLTHIHNYGKDKKENN